MNIFNYPCILCILGTYNKKAHLTAIATALNTMYTEFP